MDILFIGPYRQQDGWGEAAKDYIRALSCTGANLEIRPVYMSRNIDEAIDPFFLALEQKKINKPEVVIQNVLPSWVSYDGRFKRNIGLCYTETSNLKYTSWPARLKTMDEIWVPSYADSLNLLEIDRPLYTIPIPVDTSMFEQSYSGIPFLQDSNEFKFYFIGEYVQRKNLLALITAYHLEFDKSEPVSLVIKTNKGGVSSEKLNKIIMDDVNRIKQTLRLYKSLDSYKQEIVITDRLSNFEMCSLHTSCDCFVMPSRGESFCRPAIDAMGFGKTPIVTNFTGMTSFIDNNTGWLIDSVQTPVMVTDPPMTDLYTGRERWYEVSIMHLRRLMREVYENRNSKEVTEKRELGQDKVYDFSYNNVAEIIKGVLHG